MKVWIRRIIAVVLVAALLLALQELVMPKYADSLYEGSFTGAYYEEEREHQVLMVGDCELYENIDPVTLWDHYGITSYIRGNAQQLPWQSYYLLKEALERETPEVVIYSVLPLKYNEPQKEEYNRLTLDRMKWSTNKAAAVKASMTEGEHYLDYLFPLFRYHSRIAQLADEDVRYYGKRVDHTVAGYYMRIDTAPYIPGIWGEENDVGIYNTETDQKVDHAEADAEDEGWSAEADDGDEGWSAEADDGDEGWSAEADDEDEGWSAEADAEDEGWSAEADAEDEGWSAEADAEDEGQSTETDDAETGDEIEPLGENAMEYLDQMRILCESKGVRLLLMKAPSVSPVWYDAWEKQVQDYAEQYQLDYINYLDLIDEIGIDFATDTYDEGLHMNYKGAVKCADYLGNYLVEHYRLKDLHSDPEICEIWKKKTDIQKQLMIQQQHELDEYGEIISK